MIEAVKISMTANAKLSLQQQQQVTECLDGMLGHLHTIHTASHQRFLKAEETLHQTGGGYQTVERNIQNAKIKLIDEAKNVSGKLVRGYYEEILKITGDKSATYFAICNKIKEFSEYSAQKFDNRHVVADDALAGLANKWDMTGERVQNKEFLKKATENIIEPPFTKDGRDRYVSEYFSALAKTSNRYNGDVKQAMLDISAMVKSKQLIPETVLKHESCQRLLEHFNLQQFTGK